MDYEYAMYPFRFMNITQRHDQGNHTPHWYGSTNYSDKPWDEGCLDGGRSYFEPQNEFVIEEILGLNTATTNTVRLRSLKKLYIPYKAEPDYLYVTLTHMNEDNLREVYVGQVLEKGCRILLEGTDGYATGNHFHITANIGRYYGLLQNSNGKWCFTYEKSLLPHEAFYINNDWTQIIYAREYPFQSLPVIETPKPETVKKPTETPQILPKPEESINTSSKVETNENEQKNEEKQGISNFVGSLIKIIIDIIKKIFAFKS